MVLEKTLKSSLDCKEIQPINPKGNKSWIFIGRTDVEDETPVLWLPIAKNWLIWKDPDAEKDWRQEEKGMAEDEMVGWHHQLNGHEFEQTPGVGDGQGSLFCFFHWVLKSQTQMSTELNWYGTVCNFLECNRGDIVIENMLTYKATFVATQGNFTVIFISSSENFITTLLDPTIQDSDVLTDRMLA